MKIMFKEIMEKNPCFDGICKLLNLFNLEESVRANPELLKFLNWEMDSSPFPDERLNELDLAWALSRGVITPTNNLEIVEGFEDFNPSLSFTMSPIGDAITYFDAPWKKEPKFVNGEFVTVTQWNKILPTQADYYSMVITDLMEWCFFPVYQEENAQHGKNASCHVNFYDQMYNGHKY
jgi:hypothetical protein